jgi:hypothetical protein
MESDGGGGGDDGGGDFEIDGGGGGDVTRTGAALLGFGALGYGIAEDEGWLIAFGGFWSLIAGGLLVQGLFEWRERRRQMAARTPGPRDDRYDAFGPREPGGRSGPT